MKHFVWLSYDLGIRGDYEGLYAWLDKQEALECGDSLACFWYRHAGELWSDLKDDLHGSVDIDPKKNRIYVIAKVNDRLTGKFVFGRRKNAPWIGTAMTAEQVEDVG